MPLPGSGQISMGDIRTEIGLGGTVSLGQAEFRTLAGIGSGQIALSNFHGKAWIRAEFTDQYMVASPNAVYQVHSDGNVYAVGTSYVETWLQAGSNSDFEIKAEFVSGDPLTSGTTGSWFNLSGTRTWGRNATAETFRITNLTFEVRRASDAVVIDSWSVTLEADNT